MIARQRPTTALFIVTDGADRFGLMANPGFVRAER